MKAMILAAGKGVRMKPLTNEVPKVMLPINDKPLLEYTVALLKHHKITDIAINLHHLPEKIKNHFGDGSKFGVKIFYSFEESLLGTAGAVKNIEQFFDSMFVVVYGDNLTNLGLTNVIEHHKKRGCIATVCLKKIKEGEHTSSLILLNENNEIKEFIERPSEEDMTKFAKVEMWKNTGIYVLEPEILKYIPSGEHYDFAHDLFPRLLKSGKKICGYPINDYWYEIGRPEKYEKIKRGFESGELDPKLFNFIKE